MNRKHLRSIYHASVNVNFTIENVIQVKSGIMINEDASVKTILYVKKLYLEPATCSFENGKYLASIINDSVIPCDEFIDAEIKTIPTNFNEKNTICKTKNFYILLPFSIITIVLLIAVGIYYYLIKYKKEEK